MSDIKCSKTIYGDGRGGYQCSRNGIFTENGKQYCKQHLPANVEAKNRDRHARWDAESKKRNALRDAQGKEQEARNKLLEVIRDYSPLADVFAAVLRWEKTVTEVENCE